MEVIPISAPLVSLSEEMLVVLPDRLTDRRLLPEHLRPNDNSLRMRHYKIALHLAIEQCLSPMQRECVRQFYWQGLRKTDIAALHGVTCSTITKAVRAAEERIGAFVEQYLMIYDLLREDLVKELEMD